MCSPSDLCVCSDGVIRVFTQCRERMGDASEQAVFDELVASSAIPAQLGDIKTDQLPGMEALLTPGSPGRVEITALVFDHFYPHVPVLHNPLAQATV